MVAGRGGGHVRSTFDTRAEGDVFADSVTARGHDLGGRQTRRAAGSIRSLFRSPCSRARAAALRSGARVPHSGGSAPYRPLRAAGRPRRAVAAAAFAPSLAPSLESSRSGFRASATRVLATGEAGLHRGGGGSPTTDSELTAWSVPCYPDPVVGVARHSPRGDLNSIQ